MIPRGLPADQQALYDAYVAATGKIFEECFFTPSEAIDFQI